MAKNWLGSLLLIFLVFALVSAQLNPPPSNSGDADLFKLFWTKINDIVTPDWASWQEGQLPAELFLMEMPGFAINSDDYDDTIWRINQYSGSSPDYLKATLVDTVPAFANYFVDSGFRISRLWEQMLTNAQTESRFSKPDQTLRYESALARLYDQNFQPRDTLNRRVVLLDRYSDAVDKAIDNRYSCLERDNRGGGYCSQKAVIWQDAVSIDWFNFETINRDILGSQSQILQIQGSDLNLLLAQAQENLNTYRRQEVGLRFLWATYFLVTLEPSNWYRWWPSLAFPQTPAELLSFQSAFVRVTFQSDQTYVERTPTFDRYFGATSATSFNRPFIRITSADPSVDSGYMNFTDTATSSSTFVSFELAKVKISRPWFDMGLLRMSPIAVTGLVAGSWSTGTVDPNAMLPLYPTSFIVARNVVMRSSFTSSISTALNRAATGAAGGVNINIGPFNIGADNGKYTGDQGQASACVFDASSGTLTIPGPQIIGWVAKPLNFIFPNANVDELATSTTPSSVAFQPTNGGTPVSVVPATNSSIFNTTTPTP